MAVVFILEHGCGAKYPAILKIILKSKLLHAVALVLYDAICPIELSSYVPKVVKDHSVWQMAPISTMKPLIVTHTLEYWALVLRLFIWEFEKGSVCTHESTPHLPPRHLGRLSQIEGSRWGPIWHDCRPTSRPVEISISQWLRTEMFQWEIRASEGHCGV